MRVDLPRAALSYNEVYVALATLYLRLCGFFSTGLIVHAPKKKGNKTEIDCLAVRLPWHGQDARQVAAPNFLDLNNGMIELILCEVKSSRPHFNPAHRNSENLADVLRWAGVLPESEVIAVAQKFASLTSEDVDAELARKGVTQGNVRVRALLCCPPLSKNETNLWCLTWDEIAHFIAACVDISRAPPSCAREYGYELWGKPYDRIILWFKKTSRTEDRTLDALCRHMA